MKKSSRYDSSFEVQGELFREPKVGKLKDIRESVSRLIFRKMSNVTHPKTEIMH